MARFRLIDMASGEMKIVTDRRNSIGEGDTVALPDGRRVVVVEVYDDEKHGRERDDDEFLRLRHSVVQLDAVAILGDGEIPSSARREGDRREGDRRVGARGPDRADGRMIRRGTSGKCWGFGTPRPFGSARTSRRP